jgi:Type IV secretion system pilin
LRDGPRCTITQSALLRGDARCVNTAMEIWSLDTQPIIHTFETLINVGAAVAAMVAAFFVMLAGYQYMTAGGSVRALEAAKSSLSNALIGLAIVVLCRVVANLVRGALGGGEEQSLGQVGVFAIAMLHSIA